MDSIQNTATTHPTMEEAIRLLMTNGYIVTEPNTLSLSQRVEDLENLLRAKAVSDHRKPVSGGNDIPILSINDLLGHIEEAISETESRSWRLEEVVSGFIGRNQDQESPSPEGVPSPDSSLSDRLFAMLNKLSRANSRFSHHFERLDKGMFG